MHRESISPAQPPRGASAVHLTPLGKSALALVVAEGPGAVQMVEQLFAPASEAAFSALPIGRIVLGRWLASGEEIIACRRAADRVDIVCHGGPAATAAILKSLGAAGASAIDANDWLAASHRDPLPAAAARCLPHALSERAALILLDQLGGSLRAAIDGIGRALAAGGRAAAKTGIDELLARAPVGLHLTAPWQVVVVGKPNVGKSSLVNALVGFERAIVDPQPGTTRDVVTARTSIGGWPVELADTAGRRDTEDAIEQCGLALADARIAAADLLLAMIDRSVPPAASEESYANANARVVVVENKSDLPAAAGRAARGVPVSATTGENLGRLQALIADCLVPHPPPPGAAVPFTAQQISVLAAARRLVEAGELAGAAKCLQSL